MEKYCVFILMVLSSLCTFSQTIRSNRVDNRTNERIVETDFVKVTSDDHKENSDIVMKNSYIAFRHINGKNVLYWKWCSNSFVSMEKGDVLTFIDEDNISYSFTCTKDTKASIGKAANHYSGFDKIGICISLDGNLALLRDKTIKSIHVELKECCLFFDVMPNAQKKISETYSIFKAALNRNICEENLSSL